MGLGGTFVFGQMNAAVVIGRADGCGQFSSPLWLEARREGVGNQDARRNERGKGLLSLVHREKRIKSMTTITTHHETHRSGSPKAKLRQRSEHELEGSNALSHIHPSPHPTFYR